MATRTAPSRAPAVMFSVCSILLAAVVLLQHPAPVQADNAAKSRGAQIFADTGCAHCHGAAGISGGEGPSLADVRKRRKPPEIFTQIHDGGKAMPAFGDQLTSAQINDLVEYLNSKRKAPKP